MTRTPSRTRTRTTRSTEHAAHRPLMHSVHIALWLKIASCVSSHPCMRTCVLRLDCFLLAFLVFYLVSLFYFQPFLMSTSAPNERSMSNPLCTSSLGSVVTSDYVTPLTVPSRWSLVDGNTTSDGTSAHHAARGQHGTPISYWLFPILTCHSFAHQTIIDCCFMAVLSW